MHEVIESIYIKRSPEDVHAFLMDSDNVTLWQSNVVDYELLDDEYRKGSKFRGTNKVAGRKLDWEMEVAEHEFGAHALMRSTKAPMDFTLEYTFIPVDDGTRMTYHMVAESLGGFFGKLADPLVTRMYQKDVRSNLEVLKELLEA
jgi:carbon monoxide dehydrogenase subunit G